ncbi:MAG: hypothetical protein KKF48_02815 [Nanoarchaeota archaeon]|nr:hypothetical protein [Nanoarchaeota archaeon]MBU1027954.1 hypothetical protein [Nanoarchaeota archaeon]
MAKSKYWNTNNIVISLKAVVTSLATSLIFVIPSYLIRMIDNTLIRMSMSAVIILGYLLTWGYLSNKWWNWK